MAYFGRQALKPLQKPGSQGQGGRTKSTLPGEEGLRTLGRPTVFEGRQARPERTGHVLRAARASRAGRSGR